MILTEKIVMKNSHKDYKRILELCHASKNLYNATLYDLKQHYLKTGKYKTYYTQRPEFVRDNNPDYRSLPSKIAGQTMDSVHGGYKAFFRLMKKKAQGKYEKPIKIPKYLNKGGFYPVKVPNDAISKKITDLGNGLYEITVSPRELNIKVVSRVRKPKTIEFCPKGGHILVLVTYEVTKPELLPDNGNYLAIDLGVNNLATCIDNQGNPATIYNGRNVKSINQAYNKYIARLSSKCGEVKRTKRMKSITAKRHRRIDWILHNVSREIVNQAVSHNNNTIVIGQNKEWKQVIRIGKRNNQNFVQIPFARLIGMIEYKSALVGIRVILTEENYTSKCSALDREKVCKHKTYTGCRVKRGLFKTSKGILINADVNGATNIMRKVVPDTEVFGNGIEAGAVQPVKITFKN